MTRGTGGVVAIVGVILLVVMRPFGPVGLLIALALVLGGGLLVVAAPARPRPDPVAAPAPAPTPTRSITERWQRAIDHHNQVLGAYGAFELDPRMLLQYPALWDLSAPEVIAFHDSMEAASELRTDTFPGTTHAERYLEAVTELRSAWARADRFARSTGTDALDSADARDCRRALKLLNHADAAESAERATYLQQVLGTVDRLAERGVVRRPERARERLETTLRRAIEA
ncbi:hypothetical protein [Gordonia hydrophobica]|uniref:Secreted protein n=1 Tax=Gordonia hydrophobica TaxID=40516 RepID=A0ABZ2U0A5_9ACTN|nr:hypothetical protein [Gordonia hydrophobica]MBM7369133.1 hypothetical protein [Gordonia hydrophobica]